MSEEWGERVERGGGGGGSGEEWGRGDETEGSEMAHLIQQVNPYLRECWAWHGPNPSLSSPQTLSVGPV